MIRLARKLKFPALLLFISITFSWKLVPWGQYTWMNGPDGANQVVPWLQEQTVQWQAGHFPLWEPHVMAGQPFIGQVQPATLNPLNWILFSVPLKNGFIRISVLHWYWVLIQFLGTLTGYWLCRDLQLSAPAAVFAGCAFGLGGFVGAIAWPQLKMSAILLPLILMFFLRVLRRENALPNAAMSGALLGAAFLSGHHNVPVFFSIVMAGLWIYYLARESRFSRWSRLTPAAAFLACFVLIAAAQIIPAIELGKLSLRWVGAPNPLSWNDRVPYDVHETFSLYPTAILGIVIPGFQHGSTAFIGLTAFTLAILGAAARWQQPAVRVLTTVALAGLFLSLGGYSLFHGVLYALAPGFDKSRSPSMADAIFQLGMIGLAAYGVDSFRSRDGQGTVNQIAIRVLGGMSLFLYASLAVLITVRVEHSEEYKVLGYAALAAALLAVILAAWSRSKISNSVAVCVLVLLLLFELNTVANYWYHPLATAESVHNLEANHDIAAFLKSRPDQPRVDVDDQEIPYSFGDWFGIDALRGNEPSAVKAVADVMWGKRFRNLLAVNYFIGRKAADADQKMVFEGRSGLKVFAIPAAFPRARLVHASLGAATEPGLNETVVNDTTDLQRTVVVQGSAPQLENCDGGTALIERYRPTSVVIHTSSPCRAMVVLADVWFPGWEAFEDGKPARIWKAYNVVRGVVVEAGEHEVVMVYRPGSVFTGMGLAVAGILLCGVLQLRRRNRDTRPAPHGHLS